VGAIVCGAWFHGLPSGWHQSRQSATVLARGLTQRNTFSWAASFHPSPRVGLSRGFPQDGVYVWVALDRSVRPVAGEPLRFPLRLRDATLLKLEGTKNLPEYRFDGMYGRQYHVLAGVDFGRPRPTGRMRRAAQAGPTGALTASLDPATAACRR